MHPAPPLTLCPPTSTQPSQIKRIHEYKRQYLNILSIIWRYKQLKKMTPAERKNAVPRVCVIGGKAASAYDMAKRIIRLVTAVGEKINHDPDTRDYLRLYFLSDYNVSLAEVRAGGRCKRRGANHQQRQTRNKPLSDRCFALSRDVLLKQQY